MYGFVDHLNETDESIPADQVEKEVLADEQTMPQFNAGEGALGALALGPIGPLTAGDTKRSVTFLARFKDGRGILGMTDGYTYDEIARLATDSGLGFTKAQQAIIDQAEAQSAEHIAKKEARGRRDAKNLWILLAVAAVMIFIASLI